MRQIRKMNEERRDEVSESLTKPYQEVMDCQEGRETRNWMENAIVDNVRPRLPPTDSKHPSPDSGWHRGVIVHQPH